MPFTQNDVDALETTISKKYRLADGRLEVWCPWFADATPEQGEFIGIDDNWLCMAILRAWSEAGLWFEIEHEEKTWKSAMFLDGEGNTLFESSSDLLTALVKANTAWQEGRHG